MLKVLEGTQYKRIVIKVGSSTLTHENGKMNLRRIDALVRVIADLANQGIEVVLVSSGAVAVGKNKLDMTERPKTIQGKQAVASVGQPALMHIYKNLFQIYDRPVGQILLTRDVFENDERSKNATNTFKTLFEMGVIPIVNANDTVSIEELDFSDNDTLSACVSVLINADLLVILSDIDGFYDSDPNKNEGANLIKRVTEITDKIKSLAGDTAGSLGTGGMQTKIMAAEICMNADIATVIALGDKPEIVYDIIESNFVGTMFKK